jgi:hypothetical protein
MRQSNVYTTLQFMQFVDIRFPLSSSSTSSALLLDPRLYHYSSPPLFLRSEVRPEKSCSLLCNARYPTPRSAAIHRPPARRRQRRRLGISHGCAALSQRLPRMMDRGGVHCATVSSKGDRDERRAGRCRSTGCMEVRLSPPGAWPSSPGAKLALTSPAPRPEPSSAPSRGYNSPQPSIRPT